MKNISKNHLQNVAQNGRFFLKIRKKKTRQSRLYSVWDQWTFDETSTFLMPDVSRVFRKPFDVNLVQEKHLHELFSRKRKTSL